LSGFDFAVSLDQYLIKHSTGTVVKEDPAKFDSSASSDSGSKEEHTVPWIAALTTYFGYAVLILFGQNLLNLWF
jgi:hypothetical protein